MKNKTIVYSIPYFLLHTQHHTPHYALNAGSTDQILPQTCAVPTNSHSYSSTPNTNKHLPRSDGIEAHNASPYCDSS